MSEKVRFEGGATRNSKRPMFELIPLEAKEAIARRMELGIESHGKDNYKSGGPELFAETARHLEWHLNMYLIGDQSDNHLDAVIANAAMLCWWESEGRHNWHNIVEAQCGMTYPKPSPVVSEIKAKCAADDEIKRNIITQTGIAGALMKGFAGTENNDAVAGALQKHAEIKDLAYIIIKNRRHISTRHLVTQLASEGLVIDQETLHGVIITDLRLRSSSHYDAFGDEVTTVWSLK